MGYEVYITRAEHWADHEPVISADEWLAFIAEDPELRLAGYSGPYFALWSGQSKYSDAWFNWFNGRVHTENPDPPMIQKAIAIAARLGARVQGDDGEIYLPDGRVEVDGAVDDSPSMDWRKW